MDTEQTEIESPPVALRPPQEKGHRSVVMLFDHWFIACAVGELKRAPIARTIQGTPLVLFRGEDGKPTALLDRCPHRNVPLSMGRMRGPLLECAYHGWRFDTEGNCRDVPGLCAPSLADARRAVRHAAHEQDGYVWVYSTPNAEPRREPFAFPNPGAAYGTVRHSRALGGTMHAAIENALDVPHTGFLHGKLFRTAEKKNELEVVVRRGGDIVEAEYLGEPRPSGLAARLLAPGGGAVVHFDRFILPCVAQVEYRLAEKSHLIVTSAFTPVTDFETRIYSMVHFRFPVPAWIVRLVVGPIARHILRQDARILAAQHDAIVRFGGEQFVHTEIDVLGPYIWHLLRQAERGTLPEAMQEVGRRRIKT